MFAYEEKKKVQGKSGGVVQRLPQRADAYRRMATNILNYVYTDKPTTVAVSDHNFAITPMPGDTEADWGTICSKSNERKPVGGVGGAKSPEENHAERKLLCHDSGTKDMGVSNDVCKACWPEIIAKNGTMEHLSDPSGVHQITPEYKALGKLIPPKITEDTRFSLT